MTSALNKVFEQNCHNILKNLLVHCQQSDVQGAIHSGMHAVKSTPKLISRTMYRRVFFQWPSYYRLGKMCTRVLEHTYDWYVWNRTFCKVFRYMVSSVDGMYTYSIINVGKNMTSNVISISPTIYQSSAQCHLSKWNIHKNACSILFSWMPRGRDVVRVKG